MDMLEQRLNSSEQSNRVLMDELMRMQQDLKVGAGKGGSLQGKDVRRTREIVIKYIRDYLHPTVRLGLIIWEHF